MDRCYCYGRYRELYSGGVLPYYRGKYIRQSGFGLLSNIGRLILPIGKSIGKNVIKTLAPQVLSSVTQGVGDVLTKKKGIKSVLKSRGKDILKKSAESIVKEVLSKAQSGGQLMVQQRKASDLLNR